MNTKQITWPTIQQQVDHWNAKEAQEHERVMDIRAESPNENTETGAAHIKCLMCGRETETDFDTGQQYCSTCGLDYETVACPQREAATTAPSLTQEDQDERDEATAEWFEETEGKWSLRDEGQNPDGSGESYAARNQ